MINSTQNVESVTPNTLAAKPKTPEVEVGAGGVKVKADINFLQWVDRLLSGTLDKSEAFHNMTDDGKNVVRNANSSLKSYINENDPVGAARSLNQLASTYKEQIDIMPTQALKQEALYNANNYSKLAAKVKSGEMPLQRLKGKIDQLGSTTGSTLGDLASAKQQEYTKIIDAYTDDNGRVDLAQLNKDLKSNDAGQEVVNGVNALITPEMQQQIAPKVPQAQL